MALPNKEISNETHNIRSVAFTFLWWGLSLASIRSPLFSATGIQSCLCCSLSILLSLWQLRNLEISEYLKELQAGAVGMLNFFPKSFACCWSQFPFQLYYIIPSELKSIVNFFLWKESKDKNESYLFLQKKKNNSFVAFLLKAKKFAQCVASLWLQIEKSMSDVHLCSLLIELQLQVFVRHIWKKVHERWVFFVHSMFKSLGNILSSTRTQIAFFLQKNVQKMGLELKTFSFYFFCRVRPPFRSACTSLHSTLAELCRRNKKKKF